MADAENLRDFPVRLAARCPVDAVALSVAKSRPVLAGTAQARQPPCAIEGGGADELGERRPFHPPGNPPCGGERTRSGRLSRDMRRHRVAVPETNLPGARQHVLVALGQGDQPGKPRPVETDTGQMACPVDRVRRAKPLGIEEHFPVTGVIMDADRRLGRTRNIDMLRQREMPEAHLARDGIEQAADILNADRGIDRERELLCCCEYHRPRHAPAGRAPCRSVRASAMPCPRMPLSRQRRGSTVRALLLHRSPGSGKVTHPKWLFCRSGARLPVRRAGREAAA